MSDEMNNNEDVEKKKEEVKQENKSVDHSEQHKKETCEIEEDSSPRFS